MKEEIMPGLKSAIERGSSLESAMQSFINAGYSEVDVKDAAESLSTGLGGISEIIRVDIPENKEISDKNNLPTLPVKNKGGNKWLVIILIIVGLVVAGVGGYLFYKLNRV